ncbi:hypothetical protein ES707_10086 [subsurface metagenome]
MRREKYVLAAFDVDHRKPILSTDYVTIIGLTRGIKRAMERGADYGFFRRIRPEAEG